MIISENVLSHDVVVSDSQHVSIVSNQFSSHNFLELVNIVNSLVSNNTFTTDFSNINNIDTSSNVDNRIVLQGVSGTSISNNHITNFLVSGIKLLGSFSNTITGNVICLGSGDDNLYNDELHSIYLTSMRVVGNVIVNDNNFISNNMIPGKDVTIEGGTGNVAINNKWSEDTPKSSSCESTLVTLTVANWSVQADGRYAQTVDVEWVTSDTKVVLVDVHQTGEDLDNDAAVLGAWDDPSSQNIIQGEGTLTFHTIEVPTIDIPVNVGVIK